MNELTKEQLTLINDLLTTGMFYEDTIEDVENNLKQGESPLNVNLNDAWFWALSDSYPVKIEDMKEVNNLIFHYGWCGLQYWVAKKGEMDINSIEFNHARRHIQFVKNEEALRAKPGHYCYSMGTYTISDAKPSVSDVATPKKRWWIF